MYTLPMSSCFRLLVLAILLTVGLAPQLACFMPDEGAMQADMDCCKGMTGDCSAANMSHACCQTVVRTDVGLTAETIQHAMPRVDVAEYGGNIVSTSLVPIYGDFSRQTDHAPPDKPGQFPLVLRI
jgi:hypothetical protein